MGIYLQWVRWLRWTAKGKKIIYVVFKEEGNQGKNLGENAFLH